jgi:hypothetical protein
MPIHTTPSGLGILNFVGGKENAELVERSDEAIPSLAEARPIMSLRQKPIKRNTPWETRFRVKRADGGTNASSNLIMCHLYCQEPHLNADKSGETGCRKVP